MTLFAAHLYGARRAYRSVCQRAGKGGKQIERCVISTFRVAESMGFNGDHCFLVLVALCRTLGCSVEGSGGAAAPLRSSCQRPRRVSVSSLKFRLVLRGTLRPP